MSDNPEQRGERADECTTGRQPENLEAMLDLLHDVASDGDEVSLNDVFDTIGRRSFGPVVLFAGLVTLAPVVGDVPGMPTIMGSIVLLTVAQIVLQARHFWLPDWLLARSVSSEKMRKAVSAMRKPSRFIDRLLKPRLTVLVRGATRYAVALACGVTAMMTPAMEFIPFSANGAGLIWTLFGLALITDDGFVALLGYCLSGGVLAIIVANLM
ncbi:exopolysaccharide biosynthesis protein [Pseudohongiella sp.]|uniref:Exopolysaccharide synthesis, ExoD n=1 Tax=marine sediment metagenome TaxID=412755 RepID=A0A0F9YKF3_9ZZZZ|nr:exopolysaccharide biosynthesis protein [Pseudohongiella sp.]